MDVDKQVLPSLIPFLLQVLPFEKQSEIVDELEAHVMRCVNDQNGNHVIQKVRDEKMSQSGEKALRSD